MPPCQLDHLLVCPLRRPETTAAVVAAAADFSEQDIPSPVQEQMESEDCSGPWIDEEDNSSNIIYDKNPRNGQSMVRAATLNKLIERLTSEKESGKTIYCSILI